MQLSPHFSLDELTTSVEHLEYQAVNLALATTEPYKTYLQRLATEVLEPLRVQWGHTLHVNSGLRCRDLNNLIHGATTSQHLLGQAADLDSDDNYELWQLARKLSAQGKLRFGQLILEKGRERGGSAGWVHISLQTEHFANEVMTFDGSRYTHVV